jgi:hypothetical protein
MNKDMDLAERIATRLVERHADVLLGVKAGPSLEGHKVVFADLEFAVDGLARVIREVLGEPEVIPIGYVSEGWNGGVVSPLPGPLLNEERETKRARREPLVSGLTSAATGRKG